MVGTHQYGQPSPSYYIELLTIHLWALRMTLTKDQNEIREDAQVIFAKTIESLSRDNQYVPFRDVTQ